MIKRYASVSQVAKSEEDFEKATAATTTDKMPPTNIKNVVLT